MANPWLRVTNEFVASFAVKDCSNCQGNGYTGSDSAPSGICSCATLAFRREYPPGSPRIKVSVQRIGGRDVTTIYFKRLAEVG